MFSGFVKAISPARKKEKEAAEVKLIEKGYAYESVPWQSNTPYLWRFDVGGDELVIIYNSSIGGALWVTYKNDREEYKGNYSGVVKRYPYVYDYIAYM